MSLQLLPGRIRAISGFVRSQAVPAALDDAAGDIVVKAREDAPRVTGTLGDSVGHSPDGALARRIGPRKGRVNPSGVAAEDYVEDVEYGSQPFLRPAIDSARKPADKALRKQLRNV